MTGKNSSISKHVNATSWLADAPPLFLLLGVGCVYAQCAGDSDDSHGVFALYRFVHNNLFYPEVTKGLTMLHPAVLPEKHLYTSYLSPGFPLYCTAFCKIFWLSPGALRTASVFFHLLLYIPMIVFLRQAGARTAWALWLLLLAPQLVLFTARCDPWLAVSGLLFLVMALLLSPKPGWPQPTALLTMAAIGFLSVFLFWMMFFLYGIFAAVVMSRRLFCSDGIFRNFSKPMAALMAGSALALVVLLAWRLLAPEGTMGIAEYLRIRAPDRTIGNTPFIHLKLWPHLVGRLSADFALILICAAALGAWLFSRREHRSAAEELLVAGLAAYAIFVYILASTAWYHAYVCYYLLATGAMLAQLIFSRNAARPSMAAWILLAMLASGALYELRRTNFWCPDTSKVNAFLRNMGSSDYLIRDTPFSTWPLQYRAPEKTLYMNPDRDDNTFGLLDDRKVRAHRKTWNTISVLREHFPELETIAIPYGMGLYYITMESCPRFREVAATPPYRIYEVFPGRSPDGNMGSQPQ